METLALVHAFEAQPHGNWSSTRNLIHVDQIPRGHHQRSILAPRHQHVIRGVGESFVAQLMQYSEKS